MAIKPDYGFHERKLSQVFVLGATAVAGTVITRDTTDLSVVGVGDTPYGKVTNGGVGVALDRELGHLYYDVTATGASFFNTVSGVLDLTTKVGTPCAIWHTGPNDILSTTAYLATGTGSITAGAASGNTSPDTLLGVLAGNYVLAGSFTNPNAGSTVRAKLIGNAMVNGVQAIRVQVL
jgi:hypothetical protein